MTRQIFTAVALLICGVAFGVGDSRVGLFVTPPAWAATGTTTVVAKKYIPLGLSNEVVRLNKQAALGMCATLDGCAERYWVPLFNYPDPARRRFYDFADFYAGPPSNWSAFDFTTSPFDYYQLWNAPDLRHITNSWSRIFPVVSDRLEDVRSILRKFVNEGSSSLDTWLYSSSLFGGADTVSFGWRDREATKNYLRAVEKSGGLCLDWTCITNVNYASGRNAPRNVILDMLSLDQDEFTNVFERCGPNGVGIVPAVTNLLKRLEPTYTFRDGWLDFTNKTSRISANDFGWMNKLLAMLDKTYHVGGYDGLPIIQFKHTAYGGHATMSQPVTNGVFLLSWDVINGTVATLQHFDVAEATPEITTNKEDSISGISFEVSEAGASATLYAVGSVSLAEKAEWINDQLAVPVAVNSFRSVRFSADIDETYGPTVEIFVWSKDGTPDETGFPISLGSRPIVRIVNNVDVDSGAFTLTADCGLGTTTAPAPYLNLGQYWSVTNSGRHVRPLPDAIAPGFVRAINLQTAGMRSFDWTVDGSVTNEVEYAALASTPSSRQLDDMAISEAEIFRRDCEHDATERFGVDFSDVNASQYTRSFVSETAPKLMAAAADEALSNGTWGVSIATEYTYLVNTNGSLSIYYDKGGTNGWAELPHLIVDNVDYGQIYGTVNASTQAAAGTNRPPASLTADVDFSAAVFWNWRNLPIRDE